jgi:GNAT superfamily N-acetyltransferase
MTGTGSPGGTEQVAAGRADFLGFADVVAMGPHYRHGHRNVSRLGAQGAMAFAWPVHKIQGHRRHGYPERAQHSFVADPDYTRGEYAILVRSDLKGHGIGWRLMQHLLDYARAEKLGEIYGHMPAEHTTMLEMRHQLGFTIAPEPGEPGTRRVGIRLGDGLTVTVPSPHSFNGERARVRGRGSRRHLSLRLPLTPTLSPL